jgi:hypothetical protein
VSARILLKNREPLESASAPDLLALHAYLDKQDRQALQRSARRHELQRAQVRDQVAFEAAGVVEVELLQRLAGREPGLPDAPFAAVGFSGSDLTLQAGSQELLMGPALGAGPLGQPNHRLAQGRRLQRPGQEGKLGVKVPARGGGLGRHQATPASSSRPKAWS